MYKLTVEEKQILKARGILNQKQEEFYAIRFLSKVGYFKAEEMIALSEIAKEYGNGELSLTSRLTVEIPYIKEENIDKVVEISRKKGLRKAEPMKRRFKEEELLKLLECTIDYYNELAGEKERLAEIIERIGEEEFEKNIIKRFNA